MNDDMVWIAPGIYEREEDGMFGSDRNDRRFPILIEEIVQALQKNLREHDEIHAEALENYRKEFIKRLESMIEDAKSDKPINQVIGLTVPVSHKKSFTSAIELLKSLQKNGKTEIEVTAAEYSRYVLNEWEWIDQFNASNSCYTATGKRLNS